ncbi:MAG: HNH endonuclease [Alphaproteobacteria bacterium]|nr:HNH endonuclease [Alphaproteobacteria bacterium]
MNARPTGQVCAYCGIAPATTADHVLARKFFLEPHRGNLPQVPACAPCNNAKAALEQYVMSCAAFGGTHAEALANLEDLVPQRLEKNLRLKRELAESLKVETLTGDDGVVREVMTIAFDSAKYAELCTYIARGLALHHWGVLLPATHTAVAFCITTGGEELLKRVLPKNARANVNVNVGEGAFVYEGGQATDDPALTVWRFALYGVTMGGDPEAPNAVVGSVIAATGRKEAMATFMKMAA